jgi:hypothetical protein
VEIFPNIAKDLRAVRENYVETVSVELGISKMRNFGAQFEDFWQRSSARIYQLILVRSLEPASP